jgi:signal peptidase I
MEVIYANDNLKRIRVDTAMMEQFLLAQGMDEKKIKKIRIYVQEAASEAQKNNLIAQNDNVNPWGLYSKPGDIYLFTHDRLYPMAPSLNRTLIHELRHHEKNGYRKGETLLPHAERPSEIDAKAYAEQYAPTNRLVSVVGESERKWIAVLQHPVVMNLIAIAVLEYAVLGLLLLAGPWKRRR